MALDVVQNEQVRIMYNTEKNLKSKSVNLYFYKNTERKLIQKGTGSKKALIACM